MSLDLALTSVPPWAVGETCPPADLSGRSWTVLAIGAGAAQIAQQWSAQIRDRHAGAALRVHHPADVGAACAMLKTDLAGATVGWRLLLAGPAHACLRVRALAMRLGVGDDEMTIASTEVATREVRCAHCKHVTVAEVELTGDMTCSGCGRTLLVYYHVSRRLGTHLGFVTRADRQMAGR